MAELWSRKQVEAFRAYGVPESALKAYDPKASVRAEVRARKGSDNTVLIEGLIVDSELDEMFQAFGLDVQCSPANVRGQLEARCTPGAAIAVEIDSPGGIFTAGSAIGSLLESWTGEVTAKVRGLAASAAANIALHADKREMADQAQLMMHSVWGLAIGNADDLEKAVARMRESDKTQVAKLVGASSMSEKDAAAAIAEEKWWTQEEAISDGIAVAMPKPKQDQSQARAGEDARVHAMMAQSRRAMLASLGG